MADMVMPTHGRIKMIEAKRTLFTGFGAGLKIGLYKDALTPTAATTFATFQANECTFPGYARINDPFSAAADNGAGDAHSYSSLVTFTRTAGGSGDSVGGIMVMGTDAFGNPDCVLLYKDFTSPVDMSVNGNTLSRLIEWLQGQYPIS